MNDLLSFRVILSKALFSASDAYTLSNKDFDAGRYDGLKEAVELLDKLIDKK